MRIVWICILLALSACAPYPPVKYAEMDDAIVNAETKEEAEYYKKYRDKFEAAAIKAEDWFENRIACMGGGTTKWGNEVIWACSATPPDWERRPLVGIDAQVRAYRRWSRICSCVDKQRLLDSLGMGR